VQFAWIVHTFTVLPPWSACPAMNREVACSGWWTSPAMWISQGTA